jgi:hypothetical protein
MNDSSKLLARRNFLKLSVVVAVTAPFMAVTKIIDIGKVRKEPIKAPYAGQLLTTKYMADIVERINDLESRQ